MKDTNLHIRISSELYEALKLRAAMYESSVSSFVRTMISKEVHDNLQIQAKGQRDPETDTNEVH